MTVSVLWHFHKVPWVALQCMIVVYPGHTDLLFSVVSNKQKYVHGVRINYLVYVYKESVVRFSDHLDKTIAIDCNVKSQTKQIFIFDLYNWFTHRKQYIC